MFACSCCDLGTSRDDAPGILPHPAHCPRLGSLTFGRAQARPRVTVAPPGSGHRHWATGRDGVWLDLAGCE
eukprot:366278-Chlamydomonas_euryale.AAC.36